MGPTGTGKTCVLSAIGNELITKGYSVKFISAFDFNNLMLKYHTAPLDERSLYLDEVIEPDFLIIDDLGTENILKNVTCEYLLNMLSTRGKQVPVDLLKSLCALKMSNGSSLACEILYEVKYD